jgi:hypothetical protein
LTLTYFETSKKVHVTTSAKFTKLARNADWRLAAGLPDGIFSNQKS